MEALWEGLGTALVAGVVSLAVSIAFRWWDRRSVQWVVTGFAETGHDRSGGGRVRATIRFHNAGDDAAYRVVTERSNGDKFDTFWMLETGRVGPGEHVDVTMSVDPAHWDEAWVALQWESSPVGRGRPSRSDPYRLDAALWKTDSLSSSPELRARLLAQLRTPDTQSRSQGTRRRRS